jgi:putative aminopeptidase
MRRATLVAAGLLTSVIRTAEAQTVDPELTSMTLRLSRWTAVTGYEQQMVDSLLRLLPRAQRDRAGNAHLRLGGGSERRLVTCPLDEPGFVVGRIRSDGYLTLRRVPGKVAPLFDQQIEGERITIRGSHGLVPAVVAVRSIHLTRGLDDSSSTPFTVDDAFVDVGASSARQVRALGIDVLAPVTLPKRPYQYGEGLVAAPNVGRRAACAALLLAVRESVTRAKLLPPVTVAFTVEQRLSDRGLATLSSADGPFSETVIVDGVRGPAGTLEMRGDADTAARWPRLGTVKRWSIPVRYAGTPVETISIADADSLRRLLVKWIGGDQ